MDESPVLAAQRTAYRTSFLTNGDTPRATLQNDRVTQYLRFESILKHVSRHLAPRDTVHDIGAGLCDFYEYLKQTGLAARVDYSGTEIVQEMIDLARQKYPELVILNRNFLNADIESRYDFVILSGTFNLLCGLDDHTWKEMCLALLKKMYAHATKAIAVNFLTSYSTFSDPTLCYFDPKKMFDFATTQLSRFVTLDAAYPLYECTLTVFKSEYMASLYKEPELQKYFR